MRSGVVLLLIAVVSVSSAWLGVIVQLRPTCRANDLAEPLEFHP